jgi:heme exporter protein D
MESFQAMLHMGGYGGYVWPAYGLSIVVLIAVLVASLASARRNEADLDVLQQSRRAGRARNGAGPGTGTESESEE